ncbi:Uncharacterised protein [Klebsiella pneumoniae]|nr:Uncharacterised protein [Klebsiella pneumoniae]
MIAGSPSGIAEAVSATTSMNMSTIGWPCQRVPRTKVAPASSRIARASQRLKLAICRSSGVARVRTSRNSVPIRPSSVSPAVATTTPRAWPLVTRVPE